MQMSKGEINGVVFLILTIVIGLVAFANVVMPAIFVNTPQSGTLETNKTASDTFNTKARATYNTSVPLIWNATVVVTNVTNGFVFPATNYTINTTGALATLISSFNFNDTNVSVSYSYPNRITYAWDNGTSQLWNLLGLAAVAVLFLLFLGSGKRR